MKQDSVDVMHLYLTPLVYSWHCCFLHPEVSREGCLALHLSTLSPLFLLAEQHKTLKVKTHYVLMERRAVTPLSE